MRYLPRVLLLLFWAATPARSASAETSSPDLLMQTRTWRQHHGLAGARDKLLAALAREDSSKGEFERRIWSTNAEKDRVWPDSAAQCSATERSRTGIFIVLGYRQRTGRSQRIVRYVTDRLQENGWHATLIDVPEWSASAADDVAAIDKAIARELPKVDRALLVGFSKGGWDWINWFHGPAMNLPPEERGKIRLLVDFAAILRGSAIAGWAADDRGLDARLFRSVMLVRFGSKGATPRYLRSLSKDPWSEQDAPALRTVAPQLRAIEYVAVAEGADGHPHANGFFHWVSHRSTERQRWMGPVDGMAESAAELLPPREKIPAWIVRIKGSHALLDGHYVNGGVVSRRFHAKGDEKWKGGEELMDDFLRALPKSMLGW
ncbi:MAG: hypothetical protein QOD12_1318 [Verrucomicrobiota bacterium]|jgi:hypothetical protein